MLQPQYIVQHKQKVITALAKKGFTDTAAINKVIALDEQRKQLKTQSDELNARSNSISKEIGQLFAQGQRDEAEAKKQETKELKEQVRQANEKLNETESALEEALLNIPNLPHESVPEGKTEADNELIREGGTIPELYDGAKAHYDFASDYGILDMELGSKITGAGFPVYIGQGAKLQRALVSFFLDEATYAGYKEYIPPYLVNADTARATGQLPDKEGQMYEMKLEEYFLIPTAEVPVTNIYRDEILKEGDFPIKMCAYSPCFRREAGSYGKDVRGLNRVHQFEKVEIVQIAHPDKSYQVLEEMMDHVEQLLKRLELPYRIVKLCGGDLSMTSALTYDFEVYAAGQGRWLEVSSVSNFEAYQANRMKLRFKDADKKTRFAHTLNGSALALPRIVAALLENGQTAEGIDLPGVLHPYTGFATIEKP